ncbi:MAG: hypothetical protein R2799_05495 [Crocinitomicaceae bacterium]
MFLFSLADLSMLIFLGILILMMVFWKLLIINKDNKRGWKFINATEGKFIYCQRIDHKWAKLELNGKRYAEGFPRHILYIDEDWSTYPDWVQEYEDLIKERLIRRFKEPEFTFVNEKTGEKLELKMHFSNLPDQNSELLDS